MKISDANAAVDKEWDKLKSTPAWQEPKSPKKSEVIESQRHGVLKAC